MSQTTTEQTEQLTLTAETKTEERKIQLPIKAQILKTPDGLISGEGANQIEWHLAACLRDGVTNNYHPLPQDFEWVWASNRGTLPKRIQSHYYKSHGVKLSASIVSDIGNMAKHHASVAKTIVIDMTDDIDWTDGEFGDGGSCFWGDKSGARTMIEKNGYAFRAYRLPDSSATLDESGDIPWGKVRGYARCWVADIGGKLIVFNGYGESTLVFARWLSQIFACTYKRIGLTNNGYDDGTLWINGGTGYIVGKHAEITPFNKHDLGWPDEQDERYWCEVCEDRIPIGENCNAYTRSGREVTCHEDCCVNCDKCGENFTYDLKPFQRERFCPECFEKIVTEALDEAKAELSKAEKRVEAAEQELAEAKEEFADAQDKVDDLEGELN